MERTELANQFIGKENLTSTLTSTLAPRRALITGITSRTARIGIIGLGYIGLPLAIEFVKAGFPVTGFDIDPEKIKLLKQGKSYIKHIDISILTNHQSPMTNHQINSKNSTNSINSINSINAINSKTQKTPCSLPSALSHHIDHTDEIDEMNETDPVRRYCYQLILMI